MPEHQGVPGDPSSPRLPTRSSSAKRTCGAACPSNVTRAGCSTVAVKRFDCISITTCSPVWSSKTSAPSTPIRFWCYVLPIRKNRTFGSSLHRHRSCLSCFLSVPSARPLAFVSAEKAASSGHCRGPKRFQAAPTPQGFTAFLKGATISLYLRFGKACDFMQAPNNRNINVEFS